MKLKTFVCVVMCSLLGSAACAAMNDAEFLELCRTGRPALVESALKDGAFVNAKGEHNITPLMAASQNSPSAKVIELLIKYGADVNAKDEYGRTALIFAAENQNVDITKALIKAGADVNAKVSKKFELVINNVVHAIDFPGSTALLIAVERNPNPDVAHELLNAGANVNAKDNTGGFPLREAKGAEVTQDLINFGADLDAKTNLGWSALFWASPEKIKVLLDAGIDVNIKDRDGQTALFEATDSVEAFNMLLDAGAQINNRDNRNRTPLLYYMATEIPNTHILEAMIDAGADVNMSDKDGNTALILAARAQGRHYPETNTWEGRYFAPEIIIYLLDKGADPNRRNIEGKRALDYARDKRSFAGTEALQRLLQATKQDVQIEEDLPQKTVRGSKVNVRFAPNTKAKVLSQLNTGDVVSVLGERSISGKLWYRVRTSDKVEGWIFGEYLQ